MLQLRYILLITLQEHTHDGQHKRLFENSTKSNQLKSSPFESHSVALFHLLAVRLLSHHLGGFNNRKPIQIIEFQLI